jgi:UDP:flavonoid glycosyltransferase YjiC (YdhE family)
MEGRNKLPKLTASPKTPKFHRLIPQPHRHRIRQPGHAGIFTHVGRSLNLADAQAVLTVPAKWHGDVKSKNIFPIEYLPHDWLYQRVKVAIHHGGAGTTSASLHAGIPTITLPLAIDQFFWGERIQKLGVGLSIPQGNSTQRISRKPLPKP